MVQYQRLFVLLGGWFLVLVGVAFGLNFLLDLLPEIAATPLPGLILAIPLAGWVYFPVPFLVKAGGFTRWRGLAALGIWAVLFLLCGAAFLILHLPSTFIILLAGMMFMPIMVAAHELK